MVTLTVADTAGGIPPAVMARLFEPLVSTKDADKGTGLGLSICHGLVKAMGGRITARNDDAGAVFTITLPAAPALTEPAAAIV
jgi:signal transduction histidine kinase